MATTKMNIYQKLLEVKKRVPYLQKDKKGHNYTYATPSNVLSTLNPILNEVGLLLKSEIIEGKTERIFQKLKNTDVYVDGKKETRIIDVHETLFNVSMRMTWVDVESGEKDENLWFSSGVNGDEKGFGSACTYAERYFMLKFFNIPTDDDDPDSFQDKHLSEEERQKQAQAKVDKEFDDAIKEIDNAKSNDDLTKIKAKYPNILKHLTKKMVEKSESFKTATEKPVKETSETKAEVPPVLVTDEPDVKGFLKKNAEIPAKPEKKEEAVEKKAPVKKKEEVVAEEPKELLKQETLAQILEHEEEAEEVETITVDSVIQEGQKFTTTKEMVSWWKENLPSFETMFTGDELALIKKEFNAHYQKLDTQEKQK